MMKTKTGWAIAFGVAVICFGIAILKIVELFGQDFALFLGVAFLVIAGAIFGIIRLGWYSMRYLLSILGGIGSVAGLLLATTNHNLETRQLGAFVFLAGMVALSAGIATIDIVRAIINWDQDRKA